MRKDRLLILLRRICPIEWTIVFNLFCFHRKNKRELRLISCITSSFVGCFVINTLTNLANYKSGVTKLRCFKMWKLIHLVPTKLSCSRCSRCEKCVISTKVFCGTCWTLDAWLRKYMSNSLCGGLWVREVGKHSPRLALGKAPCPRKPPTGNRVPLCGRTVH